MVAIYHLSVKTISRSSGRSAVAAAAYRSGCQMVDERTGEISDYTCKRGVVHTEIMAPADAPAWIHDRAALWNAAEAAERRKDARTAREYEIALPAELSAEQRTEAARQFGQWLTERYQVAVDIAIHEPGREGDSRNHHAHILTTTRAVGPEGLRSKAEIELSDKKRGELGLSKGRDEIEEVRAKWAEMANKALERAQVAERIDHRSHQRRGIEAEAAPTAHLGPAATAMERRGIETDRGRLNRLVLAANRAWRAARDVFQRALRDRKPTLDELWGVSEPKKEAGHPKPDNQVTRQYVDVPFAARDQVKPFGITRDKDLGGWYVPSTADLTELAKWGIVPVDPPQPQAPIPPLEVRRMVEEARKAEKAAKEREEGQRLQEARKKASAEEILRERAEKLRQKSPPKRDRGGMDFGM